MGGERTAQHTRKKTREILGDSGVHGGRVWRRFPPPGVLHPTGHPRGASPPAELVQGGGEVIDDDNLIKICLKTFLAPCGRRFCNFLLNFRPPPEKCRPQ